MAILLIILGLALLTLGAEMLVRGASGIARAVGLPSLIIGLTVVAYGTSAPELAVGLKAGLAGQADIALGNLLGSNTFNVLFILGISATIAPLAASAQLVRFDVPVMIFVSMLMWVMASNRTIGRGEGVVLLAAMIGYTALLICLGKRRGRHDPPLAADLQGVPLAPSTHPLISVLRVLIGLGLLVLGARWLIDGAVDLALMLGVSELMIGLTIVAAGTSMPEVATSIIASIRGERDIAVGNVVGSNIFNLLAVGGAAATVSPGGLAVAPAALRFDIPVAAASAVVCLPIFFTGSRISRWEGTLFLGYYGAYVTFLVLAATRHAALAGFTSAMLWFFMPLSTIGVTVSVVNWVRNR